jgi:hypothetical protein
MCRPRTQVAILKRSPACATNKNRRPLRREHAAQQSCVRRWRTRVTLGLRRRPRRYWNDCCRWSTLLPSRLNVKRHENTCVKAHLVRYHGLFAPNARERAGIVAGPKAASKAGGADGTAANACTTPMSWMARLKRVFAVDLSRCPHCGGQLQVIALITDPGVISRILEHICLDGRVQPRAPPSALGN